MAEASRGLISVLVLLISPGVVGVFFIADRFAGHWLSVVVALVAGTLLSSVTTLWLMKKTAGDRDMSHFTKSRQGTAQFIWGYTHGCTTHVRRG